MKTGAIVTAAQSVGLIQTAAALLSDEGENVEFDNAIVQLTTALLGGSTDDQDDVRGVLRMVKGVHL